MLSASVVDVVLYVVNNYQELEKAGSSIVLYLPKIQTAEEAAFWNELLSAVEDHLSLPIGTIKVYVLVEQLEATFQLMEIRAALGRHFVGFNTGSNISCNLNGGGEGCVVSGIDAIFGCDDESTEDLFQCERYDPAAAPELELTGVNVADVTVKVRQVYANNLVRLATGRRVSDDLATEPHTTRLRVDAAPGRGASSVDGNGITSVTYLNPIPSPTAGSWDPTPGSAAKIE